MKQLDFLEARENRDTFFARIQTFAKPGHKETVAITDAYNTAKEAFRKKFRETGERAFEHSRAVVLILIDVVGERDPLAIIAGLKHDEVEDCGTTLQEIENHYGKEVAFMVDAVTMPSGDFVNRESRMEAYHHKFIAGVEKDIRVLKIKLSDRLHNLMTSSTLSRERQIRMVEETEQIYLPLAKKHDILFLELNQVLRICRKRLRVVTKHDRARIARSA